MKKLFSAIMIAVSSSSLMAQAPLEFQYQTVVRDNTGAIMAAQAIGFQISIHQGSAIGAVVYSETHQTSTNDFGLVSLPVGGGTVVSGSMASIDWAADDYFIEIEVDPSGGTSYVSVSTTQLLSVPYALNARKSSDMTLNDLNDVSGSPAIGEVLEWTGSGWEPGQDDNTDSQTLSIAGNNLSISGGNTVALPTGGDITGVTAGTGLSGGGTSGTVTLNAQNTSAIWNANKLQGNDISNSAPANGDVLKWNGTVWAPAMDDTGNSIWNTSGSDIYYSAGLVGIGTNLPFANLQIDAAATGQSPLRVRVGGITKLMVHENGGVGLGYSTTVPPADGMIVAGDVGIGTNAPSSARVHIHEPSSGASNIRFTNNTTGTTFTDGCFTGYDNSETMFVWNYENTTLRLGTNNEMMMELEPTGLIGIKALTPTAMLHIKQVGSGEEALTLENDSDSDTWSWEIGANDLNFYFNGSLVGYWDDATGNYTGVSDLQLKKDIKYLDGEYLPKLLQLRPAMYRLKHAGPESQKAIGFIAQEVQQALPEAVRETEDGLLSINYADFGVLAIKAIQEQQAEIDQLKADVEALKQLLEGR